MEIKYLIIHHSAISRAKNSEQFDAINNYHKRKGWGMIGYHYLIEPDGKIKVGRPEYYYGAHCIGRNHDSLGICLTGNFDIENPTKEQEKSLKVLLLDLLEGYPKVKIKYHRDFANKTCPGKLIARDWAKNLTSNNKTMKLIGLLKDGKKTDQFAVGIDGVYHKINSVAMLNDMHNSGQLDKGSVEWRDKIDGTIGSEWGALKGD